ncbi:MAG: P1 family peptidase [Treponema sp.]|nr:P1 family peptidase [Treponema sp.]
MKEIDFSEIEGVLVGNAQNEDAKTGVTVFVFPYTAAGAVDISGGGPASRETPVIDPERADTPVNALVLGGGSAYGLDASSGVMDCLEKHGIGYDTRSALVPIVVQSDIYDLSFGSSKIRPDKKMGAEACEAALSGSSFDSSLSSGDFDSSCGDSHASSDSSCEVSQNLSCFENKVFSGARNGSFGAGTGATVGKIRGMERSQKAGIGFAAAQVGNLKVGAAVVVNALGDIYAFDGECAGGRKIAGLLSEDKKSFCDSVKELYKIYEKSCGNDYSENLSKTSDEKSCEKSKSEKKDFGAFSGRSNTTIGAVFTNGDFSKSQLKKIASMARAAYDRCIRPVGTMGDGDTIYAFSTAKSESKVKSNLNVAGTLAAEVMEKAIKNAILFNKNS